MVPSSPRQRDVNSVVGLPSVYTYEVRLATVAVPISPRGVRRPQGPGDIQNQRPVQIAAK